MTTKTTKPAPKAEKSSLDAPKVAAKSTAAPKVAVKAEATSKVATQSTATVTVKQTGSPLRREYKQRLHLLSLGLGKMNRVKTLTDSPSVRGLILKVQHMVTVLS